MKATHIHPLFSMTPSTCLLSLPKPPPHLDIYSLLNPCIHHNLDICAICWHKLLIDVWPCLSDAALRRVNAASAANLWKEKEEKKNVASTLSPDPPAPIPTTSLLSFNCSDSPIPYERGAGFLLQLSWGSRCKHCGPLHSRASPQRAWERQLRLPLPGLHLLLGCTLKSRYLVIPRA